MTVHVRLTPAGAQALDQARGPQTRSTYIRGLIAADVTRKAQQR